MRRCRPGLTNPRGSLGLPCGASGVACLKFTFRPDVFMQALFLQCSRTLAAIATLLLGSAFAAVAFAQTFGAPAPAPYPDGHPARMYGGVPGGWPGGVQGIPYEGLRVDGYPSNRNLNPDDRSPRLGPTVPDRRETAPQPYGRAGAGAPGWGAMHQQPEPLRGDGPPQRRY